MKNSFFRFSVIATAIMTSGCVSSQLSGDARGSIQTAKTATALHMKKAAPVSSMKHSYERSQEVDAPWIVGKSIPLAREVTLPPALRKDVKTAVLFDSRWVTLNAAAERIMLATNLIVTVAPDVFIEAGALQRKAGSGQGQGGGAAAKPSFAAMPPGIQLEANPMPMPIPLPMPGSVGNSRPAAPLAPPAAGRAARPAESANGFDMPNMNAPLSQILDVIATKLSIQWKYDESSNSVRFYRLVTKTWETPFRAAKASYKSSLDGETSQTNNANALTARSTNTSPVEDNMRDLVELTSMRENAESVMTLSGSIFANPATGTITMTDTVDSIDAADSIIKNGVRSLSRMVRLRMQTIKVTSSKSGEAGLDVTAAVSRALANVPDFTLSLGSPAGLTSTNAGTVGLQVFSGSAAGSSAVARALEEVGDVEVSTEIPLTTRNRRGVYYNVGRTFSYVSSTTPAAATTGGTGGTPGITTAQDEVGLKLFMYPEVTAKDTVMLNVTLDQSTLQSLETFSSGTGINMQSVQLPEKDREGSQQQVPIRNGQTIVLTGFDTKTNQYDKRTLGHRVPLLAGGSLRASQTRTTTIVLVTAEVADASAD